MLNGERLAITTGSKNRLKHLQLALETWTKLTEPDAIIVVDWGSEIQLSSSLSNFRDPRLTIVRAEQPHWQNSRCHNLEFQVASRLQCDLVLRVDNDTLIEPTFFGHHPITDTSFYAVNCHKVPVDLDDKRNLCGTVFTAVRHWRRANGYNERLTRYGYEDEDFYARLAKLGLTWLECCLEDLEHIPHSDEARLKELDGNPILAGIQTSTAKQFNIALSRQIATSRPWSRQDIVTRWNLHDSEGNLLIARE